MGELVAFLTEEEVQRRSLELQQRQLHIFRHVMGHAANMADALGELREACELLKQHQRPDQDSPSP